MARVTVSVNVRDMTRGDLTRLRGRFDGLAQSVNMFAGSNSQRNLQIMQRTFREMDQEVRSLAGHIPHDEFDRLTRRVADFGVRMNTTGMNSQRQLALMRTSLREINREIARVGAGPGGDRVIRISARDNTGPGLRRSESTLRRWAMGPLRGIGGLITGILSDGIGQGILGAFKSPAFGTALVAVLLVALTAALSLVGAALAGILVMALGGAFVGIAAISAAKSEEIKRNWKAAAESMGKDLKAAGEPLIPVLHRAIHILEGMSKEFAPKFKEAMEKVAPTLNGFIDRTRDGFRKMGQHAWDDLQQAFRTFMTAFGPQWEDFLAEFGKSLGALARTVTEHSGEMAMALRAVLGIINFLVDAINFFARAWVFGVGLAISSMEGLFKVLAFITDQILGFFDTILTAAADAFKWVPGLGDQLAEARDSFSTFRDTTVGNLQEIARQSHNMGVELDYNNRTRVLQVDIDAWTAQLTRAKEQLKSVPPEKKADLLANIKDLEDKIASARRQLNSITDKTVHVRTILQTFRQQEINDMNRAHGGVVGTAATGGARSNMTLVGESGPELVNLVPGSHVRSNADTKRLMGQGGGGAGSVLLLKSSGRRVDDLLIEILREAIHQRGGDPVTVLGGR